MKSKLNIFVSSSLEAQKIDLEVRTILENLEIYDIHVHSWHEKTFLPGFFNLQSLIKISNTSNAALIIVTPDDKVFYKDHYKLSPRDNILFELGFFISEFGTQRTGIILVIPEDNFKPASLPTNIEGLIHIKYYPAKPASNQNNIKNWVESLQKNIYIENPIYSEISKLLRVNISQIPNEWRNAVTQFILDPLKSTLDNSIKGEIELSTGQYYSEVLKEMDKSDSNSIIFAVAKFSSEIWSKDKKQTGYIEKNIKAAKRGVKIKRLFVQRKEKFKNFLSILKKQLEVGIQIRFVNPDLIDNLEDIVIFSHKNSDQKRAYIAYIDRSNPNRVSHGKLILDSQLCQNHIYNIEKAWTIGKDAIDLIKNSENLNNIITPSKTPPGNYISSFYLSTPVITCQEAAEAKNIPLKNELKTLILKTSVGLIAVHIPGDKRANLKKIKSVLQCKEAYLLPIEELKIMGLSPGTVSAILDPVWKLPQLVSYSVLNLQNVSTNNKTLNGFFNFDPKILLFSDPIVDDFDK